MHFLLGTNVVSEADNKLSMKPSGIHCKNVVFNVDQTINLDQTAGFNTSSASCSRCSD
jgi:hypothetical protein